MIPDLELQAIWERLQMATGDVLDAIIARSNEPEVNINESLESAANRLAKTNLDLRQMLLALKR